MMMTNLKKFNLYRWGKTLDLKNVSDTFSNVKTIKSLWFFVQWWQKYPHELFNIPAYMICLCTESQNVQKYLCYWINNQYIRGRVVKLKFSIYKCRNGSVIATLGLLFKKDTPGHLNRLSLALLSGKLGSMAVAPRYLTAGKILMPRCYPGFQ